MNDLGRQVLGTAQKVIFGDVLSSRLAQVFDEMGMTASLTEAQKQDEYVCVVGCYLLVCSLALYQGMSMQ